MGKHSLKQERRLNGMYLIPVAVLVLTASVIVIRDDNPEVPIEPITTAAHLKVRATPTTSEGAFATDLSESLKSIQTTLSQTRPTTTKPQVSTRRTEASKAKVRTSTPPTTSTTTSPSKTTESETSTTTTTTSSKPTETDTKNVAVSSGLGLRPVAAKGAADIIAATGFRGTVQGRASRPRNPSSDHPRGLAVDLMTENRKMGDSIVAYASEHKDRLRIKYTMWQEPDHYNHVHISFEDQ
jgi:hypothetical protein